MGIEDDRIRAARFDQRAEPDIGLSADVQFGKEVHSQTSKEMRFNPHRETGEADEPNRTRVALPITLDPFDRFLGRSGHCNRRQAWRIVRRTAPTVVRSLQ